MRFDAHHKVIPDTLNKDEAKHYITFLLLERFRHGDCILIAGHCKTMYRDKGDKPMRAFFDSAILRHQSDIEDIDKLVRRIKQQFNL